MIDVNGVVADVVENIGFQPPISLNEKKVFIHDKLLNKIQNDAKH